MISRYDMINYFENKVNNDDTKEWKYDKETDNIIDKAGGEIIYSMDTYLELYRKKTGQSFECIYDDHPMLWSVIRCTECGTVIFDKSDEDYDPSLKCPTCTDYKTWFKFWTKEEINQDEEKQKAINTYVEMDRLAMEQEQRMKRRKDKYDWMLARVKKLFETKRGYWSLDVEVDNITNKFPLKGLRLKLSYWEYDGDFSAIWKKQIRIPLSWSSFYIQCIYKHLGKCHPDMRSKWYIGKTRELQ